MPGSIPGAVAQLPRTPWFARATRAQLGLLVGGIGVGVFGINFALDFILAAEAASPVIGYVVSDGVAALLAVFIVLRIIQFSNERRAAVHRRLRMIAEMNHHVRNALDAIQMSAQLTRDRETVALITSEVNRIEWALREVLGQNDQD